MSLIIYKCRTCTVFWYKRRPIAMGLERAVNILSRGNNKEQT